MSLSLPLSTMEEFMYWENRPAYPCICHARLKFSGRLDRAAFDETIRKVLPRHPMFTAKIERAGRRLRWAGVNDPQPAIIWEEGPAGGPMPHAEHQNLHEEIGIRFHVRVDADASELTIQFHHSCSDGIGSCEFIHDLLLGYAMAQGAVPANVELPRLEPERLASRATFGLTLGKFIKMLPKQAVGLLGARQFLMRKPVPIVPHRAEPDDSPTPQNYPATLHRIVDKAATAGLRNAARRLGVTMNDILARDLFLAIAEWRSRRNIENDAWLRMMIPMNLRSPSDRFLPAANVVSSVFLDRRGPDFSDPDRLLQSVNHEMELIKRLRLGLTFIFSTEVCRWLPGGLQKQVRADKCSISCILTNLGSPFAKMPLPHRDGRLIVGNLTLDDIDFVAPVRLYSCVTVAAAIYAHELGITLHYDPRPLSEGDAAELLDSYISRLAAYSHAAAQP